MYGVQLSSHDSQPRYEDTAGRAKLSKAAVLDRALALGDAVGLDALTIRRLATDLGVTPMALYWHFHSKEELLAALGDRVWQEIDINVGPAAGWPAQLRGLLESVVQMLRAHPFASELLRAGEKLHGEASLQATETALAVLGRGVRPRSGQRASALRLVDCADAGDERTGLQPGAGQRQK